MNIPKYISMYRNDLTFKGYSKNTIENYCSQVSLFLSDFNGSFTEPQKINESVIKDWLMQANTINSRKHRLSALKLFYSETIKQTRKFKNIQYPRSEKRLPVVLSKDEVQRMFDVCVNVKHKVIMALLYSCGLRVSELINLKWENIDRSRMIINIIQGKGNKDRQVMLSSTIVPLLEKYWYQYKSKVYVLNGQFTLQYSQSSVLQVVKQLAEAANIKKRVYTHLLRHCCFTHQVESGTDINLIQRLAGHNNVKTTMIYAHISDSTISKIKSPIEAIRI